MFEIFKKCNSSRRNLSIFLTAIALLSGCASASGPVQSGRTAKSAGYGERRLLTSDGKNMQQMMSKAEDYERAGDASLKRGDIATGFINYMTALRWSRTERPSPIRPAGSF